MEVMMSDFRTARELLKTFKDGRYLYGINILNQLGQHASKLGGKAAVVATRFPGSDDFLKIIKNSLEAQGVSCAAEIEGPAPNAPLEDLSRITRTLCDTDVDMVISFGGGSTIDAAKAAEVLHTLGGSIEDYFGTDKVTVTLEKSGLKLLPHVAIQTASSSAAHLTKYSNITNVHTGQKKLIVDNAIVPVLPVFDYSTTFIAPPELTADGALDGIAHSLEVLYGAVGKPNFQQVKNVAETSIALIIENLPKVIADPQFIKGREGLGLGTDLGGYAIMIGGTNGGHLTSFSLVDLMPHGRACAIMNPYYTVLFSSAIQEALLSVGRILKNAGHTDAPVESLSGRDLGVAVAEAMINFGKSINYPTTLDEIQGFNQGYIDQALSAAKNPQLKMKLENMPVAMTASMVDEYMGSVLEAARTGDLSGIKSL
jgi:alcohol dehydrogenase class IV